MHHLPVGPGKFDRSKTDLNLSARVMLKVVTKPNRKKIIPINIIPAVCVFFCSVILKVLG